MQPTLAAFNFKSPSNQDGPSRSTLEENINACRFLTSVGPQKRKVFPYPHGFANSTCLISTRKEERCI